MGQAILGLVTVGVMIYALVDCARSDDREVRGLPRPLWFLVILVPLVGGIAWLVYGAPRGPGGGPAGRTAPRVVAPDDDPEFLSSLEQKARERRRDEREERRRQAKEQRAHDKEQRRQEKEHRDTGDHPAPE